MCAYVDDDELDDDDDDDDDDEELDDDDDDDDDDEDEDGPHGFNSRSLMRFQTSTIIFRTSSSFSRCMSRRSKHLSVVDGTKTCVSVDDALYDDVDDDDGFST